MHFDKFLQVMAHGPTYIYEQDRPLARKGNWSFFRWETLQKPLLDRIEVWVRPKFLTLLAAVHVKIKLIQVRGMSSQVVEEVGCSLIGVLVWPSQFSWCQCAVVSEILMELVERPKTSPRTQ